MADFFSPEQLRADFLEMEGIVSVTVYRRQADLEGMDAGTPTQGMGMAPSKSRAGDVEACDRVWHLDAIPLAAGNELASGDRIGEADGTLWQVGLNAALQSLGTRWRCPCNRVA